MKYFHGHTVGGTNPSLLEAMACSCNIAAHNNAFNKAVLLREADYFSNIFEIANIINHSCDPLVIEQRQLLNIERVRTIYNMQKNINDYEHLMLNACAEKTSIIRSPVAESV